MSRTKTPNTAVVEIDRAKQFCIDARKLLKLDKPLISKDSIKSDASNVAKVLKQLESKVPPEIFNKLKSDFVKVASQIKSNAEKNAKEQVLGGDSEALAKLKQQVNSAVAYLELKPEVERECLKARALSLARFAAMDQKFETACQQGANFDFVAGLVSLRDAKTESASVIKQATADQKLVGEQLAAEPHYNNKVTKLNDVKRQLEGHSAAATQLAKIEQALKAGAEKLNAPTGSPIQKKDLASWYLNGYNAIVAVIPSTSDLLKQGQAAINKSNKAVNSDNEIMAARKKIETEIGKLLHPTEPLANEADSQTYSDDEQEILNSLDGTSQKRTAALQSLEDLAKKISTEAQKLGDLRSQAKSQLDKIKVAQDKLLYAPTDEERNALAPLRNDFLIAQSLFDSMDFQRALTLAKRVLEDSETLVSSSSTTPDKLAGIWTTQLNLVKPMAERVGLQSKAQKLAMPLDYFAIVGKMEQDAGKSLNFATAIKQLEQIQSALQKYDARLAIVTDWNKAVDSVAQAHQETLNLIEHVRQKLTELNLPVEGCEQFGQIVDEIDSEWKKKLMVAISLEGLDADQTLASYQTLKDELSDLAASKQGRRLKKLAESGAETKARKAFEQASNDANAALAELVSRDSMAHASLLRKWQGIVATAPDPSGGFEASRLAMVNLKNSEIQPAIQSATQLHSTKLNTARQRYQEAEVKLNNLKKLAKNSLRPKQRSFYEEYFTTLTSELQDLQGLMSSTSNKMLDEAAVACTVFSTRVDKLTNEVNSSKLEIGQKGTEETAREGLGESDVNPTQDPEFDELGLNLLFEGPDPSTQVTPSFRLVVKSVSVILKSLTDKNLTTCKPTLAALLKQDFTNVQSGIQTLDPEPAMEALRRFNARVVQAIRDAEAAAELRTNFKLRQTEAESKFKQLTGYAASGVLGSLGKLVKEAKKQTKAYHDELEGKIAGAVGGITTENGETKATQNIEAVIQEINKALADPTVAQQHEVQAQAAVFKGEKEANQWSEQVKRFEQFDMANAKNALNGSDQADWSQWKDLQKMLDQAKKTFNDTKNYVGALELLKNCKMYVQRIIKNPQGLKATARGKLPAIQKRWVTAVNKFNKSVDTVVSTIEQTAAEDKIATTITTPETATTQEKAVVKTIDMLKSLKTLFVASVFDGPIAQLSSDKIDVRTRRAARENALRFVRSYAETLRRDPLMVKLITPPQPFGTIDFYGLNAVLRDLDLNLQRSV